MHGAIRFLCVPLMVSPLSVNHDVLVLFRGGAARPGGEGPAGCGISHRRADGGGRAHRRGGPGDGVARSVAEASSRSGA